MFHWSKLFAGAAALAICYYFLRRLFCSWRYSSKRKRHGCHKIPHYSHREPILSLDFVRSMIGAFSEDRFLQFQKGLFAAHGTKAFTATFMGSRMVYTSESDNMKAMSTSQWRELGGQPIGLGNGAAMPFTLHGVSTTDGHLWEYGRNLIKPYFDQSGYSNLARLEAHVGNLISLFPTDASSFDIQPLVKRWFLDTSSEFLFGHSAHSLQNPEEVRSRSGFSERSFRCL